MLSLVLALWAHVALAQEESDDTPDDDVPDEIIEVRGTADELFQALSDKLGDLGYLTPLRRSHHMMFANRTPWKPAVRVYDDGQVDLTRGPVKIRPFGFGRGDLGQNTLCLGPNLPVDRKQPNRVAVPLPAGCLSLDAATVSKHRLRNEQGRVMQAIAPEISAWSDAVAREAFRQRVEVDMPAELEAMLDDAPSTQDGYDALLGWGCSRTNTDAGDQARGVAATVLGARFPELHPDGDVDWPGLCGWGPEGSPW